MKVSIITITYNSAITLRDTMEAVLSQTSKNIEYIVVDGASKDDTVKIIKEYESKFNGHIVGIINSDDFYHRTDVIAKVVEGFQENGIEAIYGDVRFVNPDNLDKTVRYYSSKHFSPQLFRYGFMPAHPTFFTYRRYFEEFGYYKTDYKIAADYELLIRLLYTHKLKSKYLPLDFMKMRMGGTSTASIKSNILLNKEIVRACRENDIWTCMPLLFLKYFIKIFEFYLTRG